MNRSLAALTLALLVGFGSTAHSNSSEIATVDCIEIKHTINQYYRDAMFLNDYILATRLDMTFDTKDKFYRQLSYLTSIQADFSSVYNVCCK